MLVFPNSGQEKEASAKLPVFKHLGLWCLSLSPSKNAKTWPISYWHWISIVLNGINHPSGCAVSLIWSAIGRAVAQRKYQTTDAVNRQILFFLLTKFCISRMIDILLARKFIYLFKREWRLAFLDKEIKEKNILRKVVFTIIEPHPVFFI